MNGENVIQKEEIINELRRRVKSLSPPHLYDDPSVLYKFLKAQDFNLDNAEKMLTKHLQWRKMKEVDTFLKDFKRLEVYEKYLTDSRIGFDKDGSLCRYTAIGKLDVKGLLVSGRLLDLERALIQDLHTDFTDMKERNKKFGCQEDKFTWILDCEMLSFSTVTDKRALNAAIYFIKLYQDNRPEGLKAVYVINASVYFSIIYATLKSYVNFSVLSKIHIFGQEGWKEELRKVFDPDELPAFLGGNKTDPDGNPLCKTFICHGGTIPEKYQVYKIKKSLINAPGSEKIILPRASFHEMNIEVVEPQSFIEWEFETKNRDIGFGVFYQEIVDGEERTTELIPLQRIDTELCAEKGMYRCEKAGLYVLLFDNTYSCIRAKEIYYRIDVVTPSKHEAGLQDETEV